MDKVPAPDEQMTRLLAKYAGGRVPPLIGIDGSSGGLLNGDFVAIYRSGMAGFGLPPLAVVPGGLLRRDVGQSWGEARFIEEGDPRVRDNWTLFCRRSRNNPGANSKCEACDRKHAEISDQCKAPIAYLCHAGLIDFAVPIQVSGKILAFLFCGQAWPDDSKDWNREFIEPAGTYRAKQSGENGVAALPEALRRQEALRLDLGDLPCSPTDIVSKDGEKGKGAASLTPEGVEEVLKSFTRAADHLSDAARKTYELEKAKVVAWLRAEIAQALGYLLPGVTISTTDAWDYLSKCVPYIEQYFGFDGVCLLGCVPAETSLSLRLWSRQANPNIHNFGPCQRTSEFVSTLHKEIGSLRGLTTLNLTTISGYSEMMSALKEAGIRSAVPNALACCEVFDKAHPFTAVLVWRDSKQLRSPADLGGDETACADVLHDLSLVAQILLLVEERNQLIEQQDLALEAVAHDIRNPVQTILMAAENVLDGKKTVEETERRVKRLVTSVRRIHAISQRIWMARSIQLGRAPFENVESVSVHEAVKHAIELCAERISHGEVSVFEKDVVKHLKPVRVNLMLFSQCVLNLVDNAVKYSYPKSEVRIDAREMEGKTEVSFVNFGVEIKDTEREAIFRRHYRSKKAQAYVREGAGIGLAIVKAFGDYYGSITVKSEETPTGWVNEFKLTIDSNKRVPRGR